MDRAGVEHEIESMPLPYVQAVISFCHGQAHRIITIVTIELWRRRWSFGDPWPMSRPARLVAFGG